MVKNKIPISKYKCCTLQNKKDRKKNVFDKKGAVTRMRDRPSLDACTKHTQHLFRSDEIKQ